MRENIKQLHNWDNKQLGTIIPLFNSWDCDTTGNDWGKDVAFHSNTQGKWNDVKKEKVGGVSGSGLAREDTSLNGGTVGNSLVRVDALSNH